MAELASAEFRPVHGEIERFQVNKFLGSSAPGVNFPIGNGLGVAVVVEKKSPGPLALSGNEPNRAVLRIRSAMLEFSPAPRDENNSA